MATTVKASGTIQCWKIHDCVGCGCVYRYRFERAVSAEASNLLEARAAAEEAGAKILETEVDIRPCPQCGQVQPRMIGHEKAMAHAGFSCLTGLVFIVLIILGATQVMGRDVTAWILGGFAGLMALAQFGVALHNPNSDLEANKRAAQKAIEEGLVRVDHDGQPTEMVPPPGTFRGQHVLVVVMVFLAVPITMAAPLLRHANDWQANPGIDPPVLGPGDSVTVTLPEKIMCVKSMWRGTPRATVENAADLGIAPDLPAEGSDHHWGNGVSVKSSDRVKVIELWTRLTIPDHPDLAGKTIRIKIVMTVTYPRAVAGNQFTEETKEVSHTVELKLGDPGARTAYRQAWWGGLVGGGVMAIVAGLSLAGLGSGLKYQSPPALIDPIAPSPEEPPEAVPDETPPEKPTPPTQPRDPWD